jgi:hypothetical protein
MIWFGSSAGVALSSQFPESRSVFGWLKGGWHVTVAYIIGYLFMLSVLGWHPDQPHRTAQSPAVPLRQPPALAAIR